MVTSVKEQNSIEPVVIGYAANHEVSAYFHMSLVNLLVTEARDHPVVTSIEGGILHYIGPRLVYGKNRLVEKFLTEKQANWFLLLEPNVMFRADLVQSLMDYADPDEHPVVAGIPYTRRVSSGITPQVYVLNQEGVLKPPVDVPDGPFEAAAVGSGCLLVHRNVLHHMAAIHDPPYTWFAETEMGDDIEFCNRVRDMGYPIIAHPLVLMGSIEPDVINYFTYREWKDSQ